MGKMASSGRRRGSEPEQTLFGMEEVMIQLRRDMGMRRGVKRGDLLRLFINNIDEFI